MPIGHAGSSPAPGTSVESLLAFADDLERRDAELARSLDEVERLAREVDEMRVTGAAAAAFLASLPAARAERAAEERAAIDVRERAAAAVRTRTPPSARRAASDERLVAERVALEARDALHAADRFAADARSAVESLEREAGERRTEAERLEARAAELGPRVRDAPAARGWARRRCSNGPRVHAVRCSLERSALAGERDEDRARGERAAGSVLGEALALTGVAGVRDRLERALGGDRPRLRRPWPAWRHSPSSTRWSGTRRSS